MKKVLLIGQLNQTVSSLNSHLADKFRTQLCVDQLDAVKDALLMYDPDLAVVSLIGVGALDTEILDFFERQYPQIPVILLGTDEECSYYHSYYANPQFDYATRPITLSVFVRKCMEKLQVSDLEVEVYHPADMSEGRRKRILAVDDSGVLLRSVKALLEKDYDVSFATSGKMAVRQAKKEMPDLILLDYEMPEWDGKRTLEEFRNDPDLKNIPVVFLTGVADRKHIMAVLELKPEGYLLKPIERERLFDTIRNVIAGII